MTCLQVIAVSEVFGCAADRLCPVGYGKWLT